MKKFRTIKDYDNPEKYRDAVKKFSKFSNYYVQIIGHQQSGLDTPLLEQISRLNQWEAAVAYSFLMGSLDQVASGNIAQNDLLEVMRQIESFLIRRQVCGVPTNSLRSVFARMSSQVDYGQFVESSKKSPTREQMAIRRRLPAAFCRVSIVFTRENRSYKANFVDNGAFV